MLELPSFIIDEELAETVTPSTIIDMTEFESEEELEFRFLPRVSKSMMRKLVDRLVYVSTYDQDIPPILVRGSGQIKNAMFRRRRCFSTDTTDISVKVQVSQTQILPDISLCLSYEYSIADEIKLTVSTERVTWYMIVLASPITSDGNPSFPPVEVRFTQYLASDIVLEEAEIRGSFPLDMERLLKRHLGYILSHGYFDDGWSSFVP